MSSRHHTSPRWPALLSILALLASPVALAPASGAPGPGGIGSSAAAPGKVFLTLDEALELAFGAKARVERGTVYLTEEQREAAEELAGEELPGGIAHPYTARDESGALLGTAWIDSHRVRTLRETVMVVVTPDQRVKRVELLAFAEPEDYVPRGSWYAQFVGRRLDDELDLKRGIRGVTGATLTARATTSAVRRVLAVHRVLNGAPPEPDPPRADGDGGAWR
jgi:hypothetical protein